MKPIFDNMKKKMLPEKIILDELYEKLDQIPPQNKLKSVLTWIPGAVSCVFALLCIFNLAMPARAENIPIAGNLFAIVNNISREKSSPDKPPLYTVNSPDNTSEIGKTTLSNGFELTVQQAYSNGLDINFSFVLKDTLDKIPSDCESITLGNIIAKANGEIVSPVAYNPILYKTSTGDYIGYGEFNIAAMSVTEDQLINIDLSVKSLNGFKKGMTYEQSKEYTWNVELFHTFSFYSCLKNYEIIEVHETHGNVTLEKIIKSDTRLDIIVNTSSEMKYADCLHLNKIISDGNEKIICSGWDIIWELDGSYTYIFYNSSSTEYLKTLDISFINEATGFDACSDFLVDLNGGE